MRVFISSTILDLVDVRAEVAELLRTLGIAHLMSDDKLSDFSVKQDVNAIETCLVNVEASDEVVVILDKRYGSRLGSSGFEDVSATHLEYRRAVEARKPIHVYVRDRLCADYEHWKRNGRSDSVELSWIQCTEDRALLGLLDEHSKLVADSPVTNWYTPFTSSIDLKAGMRKYFDKMILPSRVVDAIQRNQFPMFDITVEANRQMIGTTISLTFRVQLTNVGGAPAFNVRFDFEKDDVSQNEEPWKRAIVAPGQSVFRNLVYGLTPELSCPEQRLIAEYESPIGVSVKDIFLISGYVVRGPDPVLVSGGRLIDRRFKRAPPISLEIEGA